MHIQAYIVYIKTIVSARMTSKPSEVSLFTLYTYTRSYKSKISKKAPETDLI